MGCECRYKRKRDFNIIRAMAINFSKVTKQDIQLYSKEINTVKENFIIFDFEPIDNNRPNIIEIIKWQEVEQKI